jgi:succinoglycan biosynthesis transport protein ExoP
MQGSGARSGRMPESEFVDAVIVRQESTEGGPEPNLSITGALRFIRRRLRFILICTGALASLGVGATLLLPPRYRAETVLLIDPRREQVTTVLEVMSALPPDQAALRSEIDVLKSTNLMQGVVLTANLVDVPEFNPVLEGRAGFPWTLLFWLGRERQIEIRDAVADAVRSVRARFAPTLAMDAQGERQDEAAIAMAQYARRLTVTTDGKSLTIRLSVESKDPELAAKLANLHADLYVNQQVKSRSMATERAHSWLGERIEQLRKDVQQAEAAVQAYRQENQLIRSSSGTTVTMQQLADVNTQYTLAQADRVQSEARLQRVNELLRNKLAIDSVPEVLASPTIQKLNEQELLLRRLEADAVSRYANDNHPTIISIRAQLRDLRTKTATEVSKIAASLQSSVEVATAKEISLQHSLQELMNRTAAASHAELKLMELERDTEATRSLYQTFLNRQKETSFGPSPKFADARIVSHAHVPIRPSSPRYLLFFVGSFAFAGAASVALAFLFEAKEDRLRSPTQCRDLVGVPGLGLVPQVARWQTGLSVRVADCIVLDRDGMPRDAVRSVLEILLAASSRKRPYSVLITSTVPNEGKTVLAIWLARLSAMAGYKVLLVDADLRRPTVAKALGAEPDAGSAESVSAEGFLNYVREDPATGMHYIASGVPNDEVHGMASLRRLESILEEAKDSYDLMFVDSAPILAAPEVLSMCQMIDGVVFAARWGHVPYRQVRHAINMVRSVNANIIGAIVTRADIRKHATYAFGDVGDVYVQYGHYYRR